MASFTGTIYLTINLINHKIYIGQTTTSRKSYIGSGKYIRKAIKKYGKDKFSKTILIFGIKNIAELNYWEDFYIRLFDSTNPKIGYNAKPGGRDGKFQHSEESIEKIRNRSNQEDNKLRIREIQKLAAIKRKGSHHSDETKKKIVVTRFGKLKEIEIYKNEELVNTCNLSTEASNLTGIKSSAIKNNLYGLSKSAGGYVFKYKNMIQ
jgi:hypothetical protein